MNNPSAQWPCKPSGIRNPLLNVFPIEPNLPKIFIRTKQPGLKRAGLLSNLLLLMILMLWGVDIQANPLSRALNVSSIPKIASVEVSYNKDLEVVVFDMNLNRSAQNAVPAARGKLDTAPVIGFVVPTTLKPEDVGFMGLKGIVALAITSHPDFDDTPLWDENLDRNYENDGKIYHTHWVLLQKDTRVTGGFSVVPYDKNSPATNLPPTNPGMPIALDSPGFQVLVRDRLLRVVVPSYRLNNATAFNYDAVACYMEVNTSDTSRPMLGVYKVYQVKSGDLSLPYRVK